ncbi:Zinc finger protein [Entamoeba marina]
MSLPREEHLQRCSFCGCVFSIPSFPKVLPCLHVLCRDCIISLITSQSKRDDYSSEENEIYCPICKRYQLLPDGSPDVLPTAYKRIQTSYDACICQESQKCINKGFGYCFNCQTTFCKEHSMHHIKRKHAIEVYQSGKYCLDHMKTAEFYCYDCLEIICDQCCLDQHRNHHISSLSLFYSYYIPSRLPTLPKLYEELRKTANWVTYVNVLLENNSPNAVHELNYLLSLDTTAFSHSSIPPCVILPLNSTKTFSLNNLLSSQNSITFTIVPTSSLPRPFNAPRLEYALPTFDINQSLTEGGSVSVNVTEKAVTFKGEVEGDVIVRFTINGVEDAKPPIRIIVAPPLDSFSGEATSDKHVPIICDIATLSDGYALVDSGNDCVKVIRETFLMFGGRGTGKGQLKDPTSITVGIVDGDEWFWVVDRGNNRIQLKFKNCCFSIEGNYLRTFGVGLNQPTAIDILTVDNADYFVVADTENDRIVLMNNNGIILKSKGKFRTERRGHFNQPTLITIDQKRQEIYVSEGFERIQKFDIELNFIATFNLQIGDINAICYDSFVDVLLAVGSINNDVHLYSPELLYHYLI